MIKTAKIIYFSLAIICALIKALCAAPDGVTDLRVSNTGFKFIELSWTTPYDTASSTSPSYYQIRLSTYTPIITGSQWDANSTSSAYPYRIQFSTGQITAGNTERKIVTGLVNGISHFFAIKSSTDGINWSAIDSSTLEPFASPNNTNPGSISGHNLMSAQIVNSSTPTLTWSVPNCGSTDSSYGDSISSYTVELSTDINFVVKTVKDGITTNAWITNQLNDNTTYYWRVKAMDSEGLYSLTYLSQTDRRFVVNSINGPPLAFTLVSPVGSQVIGTLTPTFQWNTSSDTDPGDSITYTLYYSTVTSFSVNTTTVTSGIAVTNFAAVYDLIENATYFWKVHAVDSAGRWTQSSSTGIFVTNSFNESPSAFSLSSPAEGAIVFTSTPTLSWQQSSDPDPNDSFIYRVFYSSADPTLSSEYTSVLNLTTNYYIMPALSEGDTYWWRVLAIDAASFAVQTGIQSFRVNGIELAPLAFNLILSSGVVRSHTITFDWADTSDPDDDNFNYTLYYSTSSGFDTSVSSSALALSRCGSLAGFIENSTYYWKVKAQDIYGNSRFSSQTWEIYIDSVSENPSAFNLLSPAGGGNVSYIRPSADWQDSFDPDPFDSVASYTLYYSTYADFSISSSVGNLYTSSYVFTSNLINRTTYYWKVKADSALNGSIFSATSTFITANTAPSAFNLLYSSGIISTQSPVLDWQDASDAESDSVTYMLYISSFADFSFFASSSGLSLSQYQSPALDENRTYYWYVLAQDSAQNSTVSAQVWSFATNQTPEPPQGFLLLSPSSDASLDTAAPEFDWSDTQDSDPGESVTYEVWYSTYADFSYKKTASGLAASNYTISEYLSVDSTYYWRVYAEGSDNLTTVSSDRRFYVSGGLKPMPPAGFTAALSADGTQAVISWESVTKNEDGTDSNNIAGYKIYRAYDLNDIFEVAASTVLGSSSISWTDEDVNNRTIYYMMKAYNMWNIESQPSLVQKIGQENMAVIYTNDMSATVLVPQEISLSSVTITISRISGDETGSIRGSYLASSTGPDGAPGSSVFSVPLTFEFTLPGAQNAAPGSQLLEYGVYWNNGVEWIYLGGEKSAGRLRVLSAHMGNYQLRAVSRSSVFSALSIWPKIITPNDDAINDEFNCTFENPTTEKAKGGIFDSQGSAIADMENKTDYWLTWRGTTSSGEKAAPGIYIYQITCGSSVYNGTVVVAR